MTEGRMGSRQATGADLETQRKPTLSEVLAEKPASDLALPSQKFELPIPWHIRHLGFLIAGVAIASALLLCAAVFAAWRTFGETPLDEVTSARSATALTGPHAEQAPEVNSLIVRTREPDINNSEKSERQSRSTTPENEPSRVISRPSGGVTHTRSAAIPSQSTATQPSEPSPSASTSGCSEALLALALCTAKAQR